MRKSTDRGDFGFARARMAAFLAVLSLWDKRKEQGMKQSELAEVLGRDPAWLSNQLKGPGNWTLRTFGELIEAMDGEVEIVAHLKEDVSTPRHNFDAYAIFDSELAKITLPPMISPQSSTTSTQRSPRLVLENV